MVSRWDGGVRPPPSPVLTAHMSVDFSWHLEEDMPAPPEGDLGKGQQPRWGWLRRVLLIVAVLLAAAAALGYAYYHRQQQHLIAEFQRVLDREVTVWQEGRDNSARLQLILDTERWNAPQGSYAFLGFYGVTWLPIPSPLPPLTVKKVELHGDMAWVWIEWEDKGTRYRRVHFYRRVDGLWKRTVPDAQFWGEQETIKGAHFHWTFYKREAPYVRPLADWAEQAARTVADDFGLSEPPRMHILLLYDPDKTFATTSRRRDEIVFPALLISRVRVDGKLDRLHQAMVTWSYVERALEKVAPAQPPSPASPYPSAYYMFRSAVLQWETARVATPLWQNIPMLYSFNPDKPPSLQDLFGFPPGLSDNEPYIYVISLAFSIEDRYGPAKVIALLKQLQETPSFPHALAEVLGPDFDLKTFEREWHAYLRDHEDLFRPPREGIRPTHPTEATER